MAAFTLEDSMNLPDPFNRDRESVRETFSTRFSRSLFVGFPHKTLIRIGKFSPKNPCASAFVGGVGNLLCGDIIIINFPILISAHRPHLINKMYIISGFSLLYLWIVLLVSIRSIKAGTFTLLCVGCNVLLVLPLTQFLYYVIVLQFVFPTPTNLVSKLQTEAWRAEVGQKNIQEQIDNQTKDSATDFSNVHNRGHAAIPAADSTVTFTKAASSTAVWPLAWPFTWPSASDMMTLRSVSSRIYAV